MKAAVLYKFGKSPRYEDFRDPTPGDGETLIQVKAVALENIDRALARGSHFATKQFLPHLPAVVGLDGIGMLDDGRLIGFGALHSPYGAMAEMAVVPNQQYAPIPDGVDAAVAAAVPGSALTALFPLRWGVQLQQGETVLVNGATGFTGKLAMQVAKLLGAGRIVATGRNEASLQRLPDLGADSVIDLKQSDASVISALKREAAAGYDVILDFLWGRPTELLIAAIVPDKLTFARRSIRLVQIGEMAGERINLPADSLRTSGLSLSGAGANLTPEAVAEGTSQVWDWIQAGRLNADIEWMPLKDVEKVWKRNDAHGRRIVLIP